MCRVDQNGRIQRAFLEDGVVTAAGWLEETLAQVPNVLRELLLCVRQRAAGQQHLIQALDVRNLGAKYSCESFYAIIRSWNCY